MDQEYVARIFVTSRPAHPRTRLKFDKTGGRLWSVSQRWFASASGSLHECCLERTASDLPGLREPLHARPNQDSRSGAWLGLPRHLRMLRDPQDTLLEGSGPIDERNLAAFELSGPRAMLRCRRHARLTAPAADLGPRSTEVETPSLMG
jgi:hypothetical protein